MGQYLQGIYKPENPHKYKGDVKKITYRSSWELGYLRRLDLDPTVLQYSSEEVIIPYRLPGQPQVRRYFTDFYVKQQNKDGTISEYLIEIKPASQVAMPKPGNKKRKTMLKEILTYEMNQAKWAAAETYCKKKGWIFRILTEKELGII